MQDKYRIEVDKKLFDKIVNQKCLYHVALQDRNVHSFSEGNILTFISDKEECLVKIKSILQFDSAKELIEMLGKIKCGFDCRMSLDKIEDVLCTKYSISDINKFGLVAIKVEKI